MIAYFVRWFHSAEQENHLVVMVRRQQGVSNWHGLEADFMIRRQLESIWRQLWQVLKIYRKSLLGCPAAASITDVDFLLIICWLHSCPI